ncbi:hypothetical protein AVEN_63209-2-1, partial [Araneus ventricosus]
TLEELRLDFGHAMNRLELTFYGEDLVYRAFREPTRN